MKIVYIIVGITIIFFLYSTFSKEPWETKLYQEGYDEGYDDAVWDMCKHFENNLPGNLYENRKQKWCR